MAKIRPLSAELRHIAETELNEVTERLPEDLQALRDWLAKQPHLRARQDDQFLVAFLRGCKFSLEKAKSKLDHFYTIKSMMPELFANRQMDERNIALCRTGWATFQHTFLTSSIILFPFSQHICATTQTIWSRWTTHTTDWLLQVRSQGLQIDRSVSLPDTPHGASDTGGWQLHCQWIYRDYWYVQHEFEFLGTNGFSTLQENGRIRREGATYASEGCSLSQLPQRGSHNA